MMAVDSLYLQEALAVDPITTAVFEEHKISSSVLSFFDVEIKEGESLSIERKANQKAKIIVGKNFCSSVGDVGEIAHKLAHLIKDEIQKGNVTAFLISDKQLEELDRQFLTEAKLNVNVLNRYIPQYRVAFAEPRAGEKYLEKLYRQAKKAPQLRVLQFDDEEKKILNMLRKIAVLKELRLYVVGGCIRDKLLGLDNNDLDFMVVTDDLDGYVKTIVNTYKLREPVKLDRSQAYTLRIDGTDVDIIDAKRVYVPLSRDEGTLEEEDDWSIALDDIYRRDLTINAIMFDVVNNRVLDPTGKGFKDLSKGVINTIIDPYVKYRINAFDMLRALRFAAVYDFEFGREMVNAMKSNAHRLVPRNLGGDISNRRILRELRKAAKTAESWYRMKKYLLNVGLYETLMEDIEKVEVQRTNLSGGEEEDKLNG